MSQWFLFLSFIPFALFAYFGWRACWVGAKMADQINACVPLTENVSYFGIDFVLVWRRHERVFPNQAEIRQTYKRYGVRAIASFCATILTLFALALVTK